MSNPLLVEEFPLPEGQPPPVAPDEVDLARLLRDDGHPTRGRPSPGVGGPLRVRAGAGGQRTAGRAVPGRRPADAIGKRARETAPSPWREIIGVVADERQDGALAARAGDHVLAVPREHVLRGSADGAKEPHLRGPVARGPAAPGFVDEIRQAVRAVDRDLPLARVRTVEPDGDGVDGSDLVRARSCSPSRPPCRCSSASSGSTASCPTSPRSGRARWASGWHSARNPRRRLAVRAARPGAAAGSASASAWPAPPRYRG